MATNPYVGHSDVRKVYPELFVDMREDIAHDIANSMASSIIEDWVPTKAEVQSQIAWIMTAYA